jgi:hypothetical protein
VAERASRYSCAAARSFGLGGGAAFGAVLAGASGAPGAAVAAANCPLIALSFLADRVGWGFFAAGAETFFTGAGETFFAGAAFGGALLTFDGVAARDGAAFVAFVAGALLLAAGDFFTAGFGVGFFAAGFLAGAFDPAFFATGFAAFLAGDFFAAAMSCLPRPA